MQAPAPGRQTRAGEAASSAQGAFGPMSSGPGAPGAPIATNGSQGDGSGAPARAGAWDMSPELASAMGLAPLDEHAAHGEAPVQRSRQSAAAWTQPQRTAPNGGAGRATGPVTGNRVAFVREEGLKLRAGPERAAASLAQMTFGQRVHILEDSGSGEWLKIAVRGQTGYAYKPRIHEPPPELLAKDPGLSLVKVKRGQNFWRLVKERYGINGKEGSADQNVNHFINAIRAFNKAEAFKIKTDFLDDIGNMIPGRVASDTELITGVDLWIPSFGVAAKMNVGSGTIRGEVTRFAKKLEQKLDDFRAASRASGKYIPAAIGGAAGEMGLGLLEGLIDFALDAAKILTASTAVGALIGSFFGGVGAAPGAEIGFEIGLVILDYYGLYMLAEAILGVAGNLAGQLGEFVSLAWSANGDPKQIEKAGRALAAALGTLVAALLMVVAAYLMKRGAGALAKTRFAQRVGQSRLAKWFEDRKDAKTTKDPRGEKAAKEKQEREAAEQKKAEKEKAEKERAEKEKREQEEKAEKERAERELAAALEALQAKGLSTTEAQKFARLGKAAIDNFAKLDKKALERFAQLNAEALAKFGNLPASDLVKFRQVDLAGLQKFGALEPGHLSGFASRFEAKGIKALASMQLPDFTPPRTSASSLDAEGGHSYGKHGSHTSPAQHKTRLETGVAPNGEAGAIPASSGRFSSDQMQIQAARLTDAKLRDEALNAGGTKFKNKVEVEVDVPGAGVSYSLDGSGHLITDSASKVYAFYHLVDGPGGKHYVLTTMYPGP
ncbi:MAG: SH3 domain-containing protein [Kofleriaceae bacterium]